jgi:anoctamin-10
MVKNELAYGLKTNALQVAFYFAFTQSYFLALVGIAAVGVASWTIFGNFSPTYGLINSVLCIGFIEYWKFQQQELAIRWGVKGVSSIEKKRHDFEAEKEIKDPVTGQQTKMFSGTKRIQRQLLQIPFVIAASLALGTIIATCFGIEIFMSEIYNGPFQSVLVSGWKSHHIELD